MMTLADTEVLKMERGIYSAFMPRLQTGPERNEFRAPGQSLTRDLSTSKRDLMRRWKTPL
jgi:hypothetical protein